MWLTVYSVFAAHIGLVTTLVSSGDEELDAAWEKINAVRLVSPSSWINTIPLFSAVDKWEYFKSLPKENQIEFLVEVLENTDALENIIETFVQEMTNKE